MSKTVRVPSPDRGTGYRVIRGFDGKMTTVPLTGADVALYRPVMAMDAAIGGPKGSPDYTSYNATDDLDADVTPGSEDTQDQVRQLLEGKLDQADIDALCNLIFPDEEAPAPAQDRGRRRQAHDRRPVMPSRATMEKLVAEGAARRADRVLREHADLMKRFPALKNARVGG
jgi:hypothetical protein